MINYRMSCEARYPAAVQDVKAAVRYVRANATSLGVDGNRIAAWGESAGGYLSKMLGVTSGQKTPFDAPELGNPGTSSDVQAVVSWYSLSNFAALDSQFSADTPEACGAAEQGHDGATSPESIFLGGPLQSIPATKTQAGAFTCISTSTTLPPFSLAAGDNDCNIPHQQSSTLARAITRAGGKASFTLLAGAGHNDPKFDTELTGNEIRFLRSALAS